MVKVSVIGHLHVVLSYTTPNRKDLFPTNSATPDQHS